MAQLESVAREVRERDHDRGPAAERLDRLDEMLSRYLGPTVVRAMADQDVTEVYVNPQDGAIRFDTRSHGKVASGATIDAHRVEMFLNAVAARLGVTLTSDSPRLEAELPAATFAGSRLQGFVPPVTCGPAFNIRKPPSVVYSLDSYVSGGTLTPPQCAALRSSTAKRHNILIAGGTNTGKTTLANAVLREITEQFPNERLVVLEDTVELQCAARDHLALRINRRVTLADLVKSALRTSPNRIIVGEVRGVEALDLLDAWATGHPGGVATVHASSAEGALLRLDRLAQRANVPPQTLLVAEAIHLVVVIEGGNQGRRVTDVARVNGLDAHGRFVLHHLNASGDWI
jgi:type IV secretion system protein TrbB